ncbi:MAG: pyridoxal phosphate-dependent aminotransferase [Proteobacteria bacterium]|nr:pyridoxal phosphate-dependent aminotransferase [Pseudomonadota bacterium]MDA1064251.1 pyridoxal phosphate-dependent aminotransferase [Pseudomonadota bacterium]
MSLSVSKRMARIKPSPTGAALALATELRAAGRDIISLATGEPDFDTPQAIKDAAIAAIRAGATKYTPIDGTAELKKAIQSKFRRDNGLEYSPSKIIVTSGAKQALYNLCLALLDPGDEAIIPAPYWVSYPDMVRISDATPVIIETGIEQGFRITPETLEAAITKKTRLLILNSPSNPTGASYSAAELKALGAVLEKHPRIVIASDEIYEPIIWAKDPFASFAAACPALFDRVVTVNGASKAYAMTGWRIGYAAGPPALIAAMTTIQSQSTSNPCSISQKAVVAALQGDQAVVVEMTAAYRERHDFLVSALNAIPGFECRAGEGTFYAFPRVTGAMQKLGLRSDVEFAEYLVHKADLALVPGSAFGAPGYIRLSFACSMETLQEAVRRLKRAVAA